MAQLAVGGLGLEIGLIGLGTMGWAMAQRLVDAGHAPLAFDTDQRSRERASAAGLRVAVDGDEVARDRSVILLSLPTPAVSRDVVGTLVAQAPAGRTIVDFGTNDPETARTLHAAAVHAGSSYVDAPVSGGPSRARTGELSVMVGGDDDAVREVQPILEALGKEVEHVGGPGAGTIAKLLNNYVAIWGMIGVSQALLAADKLGVSQERILDVMRKSSARSYSLDRNGPKIVGRNFKPDFTMTLAEKDMRLGLELIESAGLSPFASADIRALFEVSARERSDQDIAAIYETLAAAAERGTGA